MEEKEKQKRQAHNQVLIIVVPAKYFLHYTADTVLKFVMDAEKLMADKFISYNSLSKSTET